MPVGPRRRKALHILIGTVLMGGFVVLAFVVLSRYAGSWGVPYFSFTTERGSTCINHFAGYTCTQLTLAENQLLQAKNAASDAYSTALSAAATLALATGALGASPE